VYAGEETPCVMPRETFMAEHQSGPVEVGAEMDYAEHEKTYNGFLFLAKYGTMALVVLLICMAVGFFTKAGFVFSTLLFIVLNVLGFLVL
jgi:hypothetical protein